MKSWRVALVLILSGLPAVPAVAEGISAKTCMADDGSDRAMCVTMIGAMRQVLADGKTVCSQVRSNDLSDTHAVIDFIRAHPDRQNEGLGAVTEEVLKKLHPCS
jgi:hypothetical protein